jgi:hypothetical protein
MLQRAGHMKRSITRWGLRVVHFWAAHGHNTVVYNSMMQLLVACMLALLLLACIWTLLRVRAGRPGLPVGSVILITGTRNACYGNIFFFEIFLLGQTERGTSSFA